MLFRETIKMNLLLLAFFLPLIRGYEITATGGGIGKIVSTLLIVLEQKTFLKRFFFREVKEGSDLELSLKVGQAWDRCRWFLYEHHADYQYCSFDLDADKGTAEV